MSAKAAAKAFEFIEEIDQFTLKNYGGAPVPGFGDPDMIVKLRTGATLRRDVTVFSGKVRNLWTVIGEKAAQTRGADVQQVFIQLDGAYNAADVEDVAQRRIADLKSKFGTDVYVRIVDEAGRDLFNTFAH